MGGRRPPSSPEGLLSRPRVAIVREQLEDREIANFSPLSSDFQVSVVTLGNKGPYASTGLGLPVRTAWSTSSRLRRPLVHGLVERTLGRMSDLDRLHNFEALVGTVDVVIVNETHMASSAQACELRRERASLRVITVCYENIPFRYEDEERLAIRKDMVRQWTDVFVALTPEARDALVEEGVDPKRVVVQPYGVDTSRFGEHHRSTALRRTWGAQPDDVVILFTGRLIREKGLVEIVRAAARANEPRARLVIVGDGPEGQRIDRAAKALGYTSLVRRPWATADEIPVLLASADVFVLPSLPTPYWTEQLGFSAIEAMATGLPVVAVDCGSIPFVLGDGAILAAPYDIPSLSSSLQSVVTDKGLRQRTSEAGRRRAVDVLDVRVVARRLASIIVQAIGT
jgi:glycosyltransferase involved in cell wall biosynthesis